jgi:copper ion binding protein
MKKEILLPIAILLLISFAISQDKISTIKLKVKGITCDHCVEEVKEALINVNGVKSVEFEDTNFKKSVGIVKVKYSPNYVSVDKLIEAIHEAGFETDLQRPQTQTPKVEGSVAKINVKGIECGGCAKSVENSLKKIDGVKKVEFEKKDYKKRVGVVKVVYDPEKVKVSDLEDAIVKVGFTANDKKPSEKHKDMKH